MHEAPTKSGKKPKGSGRRLYTDENPTDTIPIKFSTLEMLKVLYESLSDYIKKAKDHIYEYLKSHKYWNKD